MLPIVRCEHHLLNLSVGGKLYRNGPQREIYKGKMKVAVARLDGSRATYTHNSKHNLEKSSSNHQKAKIY